MVIVYAALLVLALIGSKVSVKKFNTAEYLSMNSTNTVRGFFIMLIFLSHFMQYYTYANPIDIYGGNISRTLGQMIVVMFMFYSGYGVCESVKRKGGGYVKSFPKNRVFKTLLHFDIAMLIYFILSLILKLNYPAQRVLLALIGWESIGNSNWYIFAVLVLYLLTWVAFSIFRKNRYFAAVLTTALIGVYIAVIYNFKEYWWYDTVLCYAAGMWYSLGKDKIEKLLTKNNVIWLILAVALAVGWWYVHKFRVVPALRVVEAIVFSLLVIVLSLKISINNKPLEWLGKHTFEIYVLMRIPMKLLHLWGLKEINLYLYFFASLAATLVICVLFSMLLKAVDKLVFKPKKA